MSTNTGTRVQIIENARPDDVRPGDHVARVHTWESRGATLTQTREGIAHHRDDEGDWFTEEGALLAFEGSEGETVTHTIRRTVQDLPTKDGAVIVPAEGHEYITAATGDGRVCHAREAVLEDRTWWAAWRAHGFLTPYRDPEQLTPGTWKKDDHR